MQFPTGGKAHEPQGMIRCDSEADSRVWMKEDCEHKHRAVILYARLFMQKAIALVCDTYQSLFVPQILYL